MPSVKEPHPELCPRLKTSVSVWTPEWRPWNISSDVQETVLPLLRSVSLHTFYNHSSGSTAFVHCHFSNADLSNRWINAFHVSLTSLLLLWLQFGVLKENFSTNKHGDVSHSTQSVFFNYCLWNLLNTFSWIFSPKASTNIRKCVEEKKRSGVFFCPFTWTVHENMVTTLELH